MTTGYGGRPAIGNTVSVALGDVLELVDDEAERCGQSRAETIRQVLGAGCAVRSPGRIAETLWRVIQRDAHAVERSHGLDPLPGWHGMLRWLTDEIERLHSAQEQMLEDSDWDIMDELGTERAGRWLMIIATQEAYTATRDRLVAAITGREASA